MVLFYDAVKFSIGPFFPGRWRPQTYTMVMPLGGDGLKCMAEISKNFRFFEISNHPEHLKPVFIHNLHLVH